MKVTIIKSNVDKILSQIENKEEIINITAIKCNLETIPILDFPNLKVLDLSYNNISSFENLPSTIEYLNLQNNQFEYFEDLEFPPSLVYLNYNGNKVSTKIQYRSKLIKRIKQTCPEFKYLDNVPIKLRYAEMPINISKFDTVMDFTYEMFGDEI
ncbi:unnamed protein product (macronuclear) [Paramecium tetraurelia]|uniref:Leucine-rich repeat protein n=1 Tax=Paramecium tetraurelia TaxID=5888 RepID=A0BYT7_PARTE|nr:uncharacterized protein GSPATT00033557001 [Paramecium tetraurelia]CAK63704.1 unnamed protein product [Paramecium tetraurelia]|eukprot:XP_001431102.1 hypothetical protein (macronuclear) [Paramecium tetraurelia strain d4-2]